MFDERITLMTIGYLKSISEEVKARIQDMLFELKEKSEREKFEFDYLQVFKSDGLVPVTLN